MRPRSIWLRLGLALASAATAPGLASAAEPAPKTEKVALGVGPAYSTLGQLPMMHEGRLKPIDTVAREEIKQIYTRETIKLTEVKDGVQVVTTWSPVAAFFDWTSRPKFWDAQPIIAVEYLPLKQFLMADEIRHGLEAIESKAATSADDRARIKAVLGRAEIGAGQLRDLVRESKLAPEDGRAVLALAAKVGEETKWFAPSDLEEAQVLENGKEVPFDAWLRPIIQRVQSAGSPSRVQPKLTDLEEKGFEVGAKLAHYRAIRDLESFGPLPLLAMPRPSNATTIAFTAEAFQKAQETGGLDLPPLEHEAATALVNYLNDIPGKDRAMPGADPKFDEKFVAWLKAKSAWVQLGVLREASIDDLAKAGFPTAKVGVFRAAYQALLDAEKANPGRVDAAPALALIDASRDLGRTINPDIYPTAEAMAREVHFNDVAPFFKAPMAYGAALVLLILSLPARGKSAASTGKVNALSSGLYLAGIAAFAAGIGLEVYGFFLRVKISGWAPVSNMYETVIWVALVTSVLGMVLEAIYRKTFAALAAAGVALVGTTIAATVPLLDPDIPMLPPVLRSNYWLTIHVLTIVSSYAAFALAMGLGLVATTTYLTATYKRSATLGELASPILPGLPLLGLGITGYLASYGQFGAGSVMQEYGFYPSIALASIGGLLAATGVLALAGEGVNRVLSRGKPSGPAGESDLRASAMQATASQIKPMAAFIYRSMQVGILLVAAGTFLGGWWADVSWGRFWGWDPKEVWALITLLVYLMPLHGRFAGWVNTFWLVMSSVVCFLSVLMAWYGVNFVLGVGLHSYGFTEGGSQGTVGVATLVVLSYASAAFWRRLVSSKLPTLAA